MRRAVMAFALSMMAACGVGAVSHAPPLAVHAVAADLRDLRVYVAPTVMAGDNLTTDAARRDAAAANWRAHFADSLTQAGLRATTVESAPHDLTARVAASYNKQAPALVVRVELLDAHDTLIAGRTFSNGDVDVARYQKYLDANNGSTSSGDEYQQFFVAESVNELVASPRLAEVARRRPATTTATSATTNAQTPATTPGAPAAAMKAGAPQRTAYAAVIGIDRYRDLPAATGARADAEHVAALLRTTLGIPEDNIRVALDDRATRTDITQALAWLVNNVPAGGRAYFFYSGHGSPDIKDGSPLIVPYDASATAIAETALPLADVYKQLASTKGKDAVALIDACFSGAGGRSVLPAGARPLMRVKEEAPAASLTVFSSASGAETSGPAAAGGQGVFTKFVVEGVGTGQADINGDGQVTMAELAEWVSPRVASESRAQSREQHPILAVGGGVGDAKNVALVWGVAR